MSGDEPLRAVGWLLIAGAGVFFGLGFGSIPFNRSVLATGSGSLAERLRAIAADAFHWRWITSSLATAVVVTAVALALLAQKLAANGDSLAVAGFVLYAIGAALQLASVASHQTLTVWAGRGTAGDADRRIFQALYEFAETLYGGYMLLAYAAIALFGGALLGAPSVPAWTAWGSVGFGVLFAATFPLKYVLEFWIADLPLWIHVWAIVIGTTLVIVN